MVIRERGEGPVVWMDCDGIPFPHGFSTRLGGVSEEIWASMNLGTTRGDEPDRVRENYRRFCAAVGVNHSHIVMSNQVHGDVVRAVTKEDIKTDLYAPEGYEADGLITNEPGVCLVVFSADCIPILLCDPVKKVIAAVHAGWRGTALAIGGKAVERMAGQYGCRREDIVAAIGPGIDRCCFETHGDVPDALVDSLGPRFARHIVPLDGGKYSVDLKGVNHQILVEHGLKEQHIAVCRECTACLPQRYWSHRVTQGRRGSQAAVIEMPEE